MLLSPECEYCQCAVSLLAPPTHTGPKQTLPTENLSSTEITEPLQHQQASSLAGPLPFPLALTARRQQVSAEPAQVTAIKRYNMLVSWSNFQEKDQ